MKVLVTGAYGQLGLDVVKALEKTKDQVLGAGRDDFDITDEAEVRSAVLSFHPDIIVHCAAYTAVDKAEKEEELCFLVNQTGTKNLAMAAREADAKLVYISTDYVFEGTGTEFYKVNDSTNPLGAYGRSKLAGEQEVQKLLEKFFIIRVSWIYGIHGNNFVKTMLRLSEKQDEVQVVNDQIGSPTYTRDIADKIIEMISTEKYGIYHLTCEGTCSWADFAREIFFQEGKATVVKDITTKEFNAAAARPLNSRLSKESLDDAGFSRLPHWKDSLRSFLSELRETNL